jgi:hypothetical protein
VTVTPIRPDIAPSVAMPNEPNPILIQYLEEMLAEARSGQMQAIIWAALHPADLTSHGRAGTITAGLIGRLEVAKIGALKVYLEDAES